MPLYPQAGGLLPNSVTDPFLADMPGATVKGRALAAGAGDPANLTQAELAALIPAGVLTNAQHANMPDGTIKGRALSAGAGVPVDLTPAQVWTLLGNPVFTQCRLNYRNGSQISLDRCNGCWLTIDNVPQVIPEAGVVMSPAGLSAGASYYIYASMVGAVMTISAYPNAPVIDARNGLKVLPTAPHFTLVGMAFANTGPTFVFQTLLYLVKSYYNRRYLIDQQSISMSTASTTDVSLQPGGVATIMEWSDEVMHAGAYVYGLVGTSGGICYINVAGIGGAQHQSYGTNPSMNLSFSGVKVGNDRTQFNSYATGSVNASSGQFYGTFWQRLSY
jgi:hypothetical protein